MVPTYEAGRDTKATEENIISLAGRGTARGKCHRLRRKALQSRSDCRIWPLGAGTLPGGLRLFTPLGFPDGVKKNSPSVYSVSLAKRVVSPLCFCASRPEGPLTMREF